MTQPVRGARSEGALGFVKGTGMGLTGFVLKNISAIIGPFGYTMKGLHKELLKSHQPTHFIRKARILEGGIDHKELDDRGLAEAKEIVDHGWSVLQQIWDVMEEKKAHGVLGRVKERHERKNWRANGAFENVEMAEKVLEANKNGDDMDKLFKEQRTDSDVADAPKKDVVDEITDEKK